LAEIKSALELALEKSESYGRASKEEMAAAQSQERGRELAVQFLKEEGDLASELEKLSPLDQAVALKGVKEVFLRNIRLPRLEVVDPHQDRVLAGLLLVARDRKAMSRLQGELERLLSQYLQIRQNALQQLKARVSAAIPQMERAMEAKTGQRMRLDAEQLPQFQEEWRRFQGQLQEQFEPMLEGIKNQILHQ
jgi:hypothetical protein